MSILKKESFLALKEMMSETDPFWYAFGLSLVNYSVGKKQESDNNLIKLIKEYQDDSSYQIAEIYAYRGETGKAFDWLERAYRISLTI